MRIVGYDIYPRRITNCKFIGTIGEDSLYLFRDRPENRREFYLIKSGIKIDKWSSQRMMVKVILTEFPTGEDELSKLIRDSWTTTEPDYIYGWDNGRIYT